MPYYMGDYYRGDYYRGDFWSKAKKRVIKGATKLLQYAAPAAAPIIAATPVGRVAAPVIKGIARVAKSPAGRTVAAGAGLTLGAMGVEAALSGGGGGARFGKRINVTNVKALRRAGRRMEGFLRLAKSIEKKLPHTKSRSSCSHRRVCK